MSRDLAPLILTAELPGDLHRQYTALRTAHFPPERNHLDAHVTLFHSLPPQLLEEARRFLATMAGEVRPPRARAEGVMEMGSGTAIRIHSPELLELRDAIVEHFHGMLTQQDQHRPRLHVTVQNKVAPKEAKALQNELSVTLEPRDFAFPALALHLYRGGPWEFVRRFPFRG